MLILERRHTHTSDERKEIPIDCRKSHPPPFSPLSLFPLLPLFISFAPLLKSFARSAVNGVCVCSMYVQPPDCVCSSRKNTHTHTGKTLLPRRQRWMTVFCCLVARKPVAAVELANLMFLCLYVCVCFGRCRWPPPPPSHCWLVSLSVSVCVCVCVYLHRDHSNRAATSIERILSLFE